MTKKNKLNILCLLLILMVSGFFMLTKKQSKKIVIGNTTFFAETVSRGNDLEKGLGQRDNLCEFCGMLFEFPVAKRHSFWMKDMKFPLDIIWINNKQIVYVEKNVSPNFKGVMSPIEDSNEVLEINAGSCEKYGIKVGDTVSR